MQERHPLSPEAAIFQARITPHRSLGEKGFRLVMTLVCFACIFSSIPFIVLGAWPVTFFLGLDVVALYIAFKVNFRDARGFEEVMVSPLNVTLARVSPKGERSEWRFDTLFTKLEREDDEDYGLMKLAIVSRGQSVPVAQALSPPERDDFAKALSGALRQAKGG